MEEQMKTLAKMRKIGGSLVITVPAHLVKEEQFQENEIVEIEIKKHRKSYFGALKGIGSYNRNEDRLEDRDL